MVHGDDGTTAWKTVKGLRGIFCYGIIQQLEFEKAQHSPGVYGTVEGHVIKIALTLAFQSACRGDRWLNKQ